MTSKPEKKKLALWKEGKRKFWINKRRKVKFNAGMESFEKSKKILEELKS